jgi:protein disulfide-isomerase
MKTARFLATLLAAIIPGVAGASAADGAPAGWTVDFGKASARAAAEGRPILVNFTGSDWCVWCLKLRDEVFAQQHFLDFAASSLVLVELDFPRSKELPEGLVAQNRALRERFQVSGYPTVILLNSRGEEIGRLGYMQGGAKTFVREIRRLVAADGARAAPPPS